METEAHDATTEGTEVSAPAAPVSTDATPEIPEARRALVKQWIDRVKADKKHFEKAFERMHKCQKIAAYGSEDDTVINGDSYVVPIINRFVNTAVASLYAKNPKAIAKRKQKLMFQLWDGDPSSLQQAVALTQQAATMQVQTDLMTGQPIIPPELQTATALLQEVQTVKAEILQYERMAKTMQILFAYYLDEQDCGYKEQLKAMVRRTKVNGVAYVELGFQRKLRRDPDIAAQIADVTSQVLAVEAGLQRMQEGQIEPDSASAEELKLLLADLQSKVEIIVREGPVLSFPRSTEIIPDKKCRHLKTFAGARWVSREFDMDPDDVLETYNVNIKGKFTPYKDDKVVAASTDKGNDGCCRVWRIYDKRNQQMLTVCDGYPDFLVEPSEMDVKIERFWPIFPLVLNEIEKDDEIFPPSDVWNARHMQKEYNSTRQGLREHKIAARPKYAAPKGRFEKDDLKNLSEMQPHDVVFLNALTNGEKVSDILQRIEAPGIDPNLYEVETTFADIQRTVGAQEANFGGTSGDTATESSIAENSRQTSNGSDVDDLDDLLSALTRAMGQLMLLEVSKETVVEICGPGAVWPDLPPSRSEIAKDLLLQIEAGSSGRPNKAAELANMERAMPFVSQLPGINPLVPAKKYATLLDWDVEEAIVEGMPSIVALNQSAGRNNQAGGDPSADPNQQGDKGGQNTTSTQANEPGAQPAHPAPGEGTPAPSFG